MKILNVTGIQEMSQAELIKTNGGVLGVIIAAYGALLAGAFYVGYYDGRKEANK